MQAADLARRLGRADLLARAALGYRGPAEMGTPSDSLDDRAARRSPGGGRRRGSPSSGLAFLSCMVGTPPLLGQHGDPSAVERGGQRRVRAAIPSRCGDALSARLWASLGPDAIDERLAVGRELLALGEREQSLLLTMLAHDAAFGAHLLRGDLEAATRSLRTA